MININNRSDVPIFEQIVLEIGRLIAYEILKPHEQLPSVRNLAKDLGINPNTVMRAYNTCEQENLIYSRPGLGFFVQEENEGLDNLLKSSYQDLFKLIENIIQLGEPIEKVQTKIEEAFQ